MSDSVKAEQITFYSQWLPKLSPGEYSVEVEPTLRIGSKVETTAADAVKQVFHVDAPRWSLTGSEVYSCYPSPGEIGNFSSTLPHIVFDRCTLPWERSIDGTDATKPHDPWLALILLTDSDFDFERKAEDKRVRPIQARPLSEILNLGTNVIAPKVTLNDYDDPAEELCQTIDLPAQLFGAVMPRREDLPYLAHVREVKTDNKETWSLLKEGRFSVVICNRFPETQVTSGGAKDWGVVNTMLLVSLDGWNEHLNNLAALPNDKVCRLVVLASWRFTCQGRSTFAAAMENLNEKDQENRLLSLKQLNGQGRALDSVNHALKMGFAPVNHDLWNEDDTISWYRGPLVPMDYTRSMSYVHISCADAALRYNSDTGMFDASYAAAWELGRLLALQDQAFAQALFAFRDDYERWVRQANTNALKKANTRNEDLRSKFRGDSKPNDDIGDIRAFYAKKLAEAQYFGSPDTLPSKFPEKPPEIPATVQNWLGQALLLYGVPFQYLVPAEAMLPQESIRFFYLNPEWINCLLQGACSVGRTSETDELADQILRARFFDVSQELAAKLRSDAKKQADSRRGGQPEQGNMPTLGWPLSGYLMRSEAVETWIGLESTALSEKNQPPLQILRMDRLAPDILLCIYNGFATDIEVKQPPEAVHFGAAIEIKDKKTHYQKIKLRKVRGDAAALGDDIEPHKSTEIRLRSENTRVVDVTNLAAAIRSNLGMTDRDFTSAEFAVEMIDAPAKVKFTGNKPKP
ncbi:MAG: hypothetical protein WAM39_30875 [Bryobacteraceae bacterium]